MYDNYKHTEITEKIIKAFYNVYNTLGYGFLEKVYENAMLIELNKLGLWCENQEKINVYYNKKLVGDYYADIVVENKVIIELKAIEKVNPIHETQLVNYLKSTTMKVGLLLNFGKQPQHIRKVLSNENK